MTQTPGETTTLNELGLAVLDALYEEIAVINHTGQIVFVNQAWKQFATQNNYNNATCGLGQNYLTHSRNTPVSEGIQSVLNGEQSHYTYEYPCDSPDEKRWFLLYVTPLKKSAHIAGAVTSHVNITDRKLVELRVKELQDQLLETERDRVFVETAGATAHEINQPLTTLLGVSHILLNHENLSEKQRELIREMEQASQRINTIVKKMRQVQKYTSKPYIGQVRIADFDASGES